jgi:hypothetical protein
MIKRYVESRLDALVSRDQTGGRETYFILDVIKPSFLRFPDLYLDTTSGKKRLSAKFYGCIGLVPMALPRVRMP